MQGPMAQSSKARAERSVGECGDGGGQSQPVSSQVFTPANLRCRLFRWRLTRLPPTRHPFLLAATPFSGTLGLCGFSHQTYVCLWWANTPSLASNYCWHYQLGYPIYLCCTNCPCIRFVVPNGKGTVVFVLLVNYWYA